MSGGPKGFGVDGAGRTLDADNQTTQSALLAQAHDPYQQTLFTTSPTLPELSLPPPVRLSHRTPTPRSGFATRDLEVNRVQRATGLQNAGTTIRGRGLGYTLP
jgi:hypothetical protein